MKGVRREFWGFCVLGCLGFVSGCSSGGSSDSRSLTATSESCMACHNGSAHDNYAGSGLENPHPFPGAGTLKSSTMVALFW